MQARGEFALVKEELEAALELSGQPVKRGTMAHKHIVYMMLVDVAARLGDRATLERYLPLLEELATRDDHRPYLAVAHRSWGVLCRLQRDYDQAEVRLKQALAVFEERDAQWQAGNTLAELAELALAQADEVAARDYFARALAAYESLKAVPDVERIQLALEAIA